MTDLLIFGVEMTERDGGHEANQNHSIRNLQIAALVDTENSIESTSLIAIGCPPTQNAGNSRSLIP